MYCECGCGQTTRVSTENVASKGWIVGRPLRFVSGHQRGHFHKKPSKGPRIALTAERWYITGRSGEDIPWSRVVYENAFLGGEELPKEARIHHIDGNGLNDEPANLELVPTHREHVIKHRGRKVVLEYEQNSWRFDSLSDAAAFLGVSCSCVYHWAAGERKSRDGWIASYAS